MIDKNEKIKLYLSLLKKWNKKINLVQSETIPIALDRHIKDSQQICVFLDPEDFIIDIGSGAGFPGVILSIFGFKNIILCEKSFKKSMFLKEVKSKLSLNFDIFCDDVYNLRFNKIENVSRETICNLTAVSRAFGSLSKLLDIMNILGINKGIFHKGENYQKELNNAYEIFHFKLDIKSSIMDSRGVILIVSDVRRR